MSADPEWLRDVPPLTDAEFEVFDRRNWIIARLTAARWNYISKRERSGAAHVPPLIWIVR
jgi:hypothetical protein